MLGAGPSMFLSVVFDMVTEISAGIPPLETQNIGTNIIAIMMTFDKRKKSTRKPISETLRFKDNILGLI